MRRRRALVWSYREFFFLSATSNPQTDSTIISRTACASLTKLISCLKNLDNENHLIQDYFGNKIEHSQTSPALRRSNTKKQEKKKTTAFQAFRRSLNTLF